MTDMKVISAMSFERYREHDRQAFGCGLATIKHLGWTVEHDAENRCWDVCTPAGWRACFNTSDLWNAIQEGRSA